MCSFAAETFATDREDHSLHWWRRTEKRYREMTDEEVTALVDAFLVEEMERRAE